MHKYTFTDGHFGTGLFEIAPGVYMKPAAFANHINNVIQTLESANGRVLLDTGAVILGKRVLIEQGSASPEDATAANACKERLVKLVEKHCDFVAKPKAFADILPDFLSNKVFFGDKNGACKHGWMPDACPHGCAKK